MLNVAVLDDRKTNRSILIKLAQSLDAKVTVEGFADPDQLLQHAGDQVPDLVITDYSMPGMSGADFIRNFRKLPACADVPVMVVTAYDQREYRYDALRSGATDFLLTPLDRVEFCSRARNLLTMRRQQRIIRQRARSLERRLRERSKLQETALRASEEKLRLTINTVPAMVNAVDRDNRCVFVNNEQGLVFGVDPDTVVGCTLADSFGPAYAEQHARLNNEVLTTGRGLSELEETVTGDDGSDRIFLTTKAPLYNVNNEIASVVTVSIDITRRKVLENQLQQKVYYDALSGLPNRVLFQDRLTQAIERAHRGGTKVGVLYVDLDQFKDINAAWGHSVGDEVLQGVAERLSSAVRPTDTVARLSADEFVVMADGMTGATDAHTVADRLRDAIAQPIPTATTAFPVQASIGIAVYPYDGHSPEELLKNGNSALAQAKARGGERWAFYTPELSQRAYERVYLEGELRQALAHRPEQLTIAVQPIVRLATGTTVAHEALVRWQHPDRGLIAPDKFIPLAETSGLIDRLGRHVLECAAGWAARGDDAARISVNVAPQQLLQPSFTQTVKEVVEASGLPPHRLELEITENVLLGNEQEVIARLEDLRGHGFGIAIDDFGAGYSSLRYMQDLPVNRLKLDRSFVTGLSEAPNNQAIVRTVATLCRQFGLEMVAEGAESAADVRCLQGLDVDEVQGFYYGRPALIA